MCVCVWESMCIHGYLWVCYMCMSNEQSASERERDRCSDPGLTSERRRTIKIGLFIKEQTYWIKHTAFTRLFVQDILHYHEDRTYISIKSFDIQWSSVQKTWLYLPFCQSLFLVNCYNNQPERLLLKSHTLPYIIIPYIHIFSGHEVTRDHSKSIETIGLSLGKRRGIGEHLNRH